MLPAMSAETDFDEVREVLMEARGLCLICANSRAIHECIDHNDNALSAVGRLAAQHAEARRALSTIAGMGGPIGVFAGNELAKLNTP